MLQLVIVMSYSQGETQTLRTGNFTNEGTNLVNLFRDRIITTTVVTVTRVMYVPVKYRYHNVV